MSKYKVVYEFRIIDYPTDGQWHETFLDNNGEGYDFDEAEYVACQLRASSVADHRNVEVQEV